MVALQYSEESGAASAAASDRASAEGLVAASGEASAAEWAAGSGGG